MRTRVIETVNTSHTTAHVNHPVVVCETDNTGSTPARVDQLASVLLAQQLPPLPKFSGEIDASEAETGTFQEWLKQFEMIADICNWSSQAKLVNLITRLGGQAYVFFSVLHYGAAYQLLTISC